MNLQQLTATARLRLVRLLNGAAVALGGGILLLNSTHPEIITQAENALPVWTRAAAMLAWCILIDRLVARKVQ